MSDKIDNKVIIPYFLKAKRDHKTGSYVYPISLDGLVTLFHDFIIKYGLQDTISVSFLNEIIQTKTEELYTISSEHSLNGINVTNIIVPKFIDKSESDLQTRPSSTTSDEDEDLEDEKSKYYRKVFNEISLKIPEIIGSKPLNFIIWSSDEHMSLIAKCINIFYFLDSCGYYFQRFPLCDSEHFKLGKNTFYVESQIQADNFSCGSYCFEFAKELTEKFLDLEKKSRKF